MTTGRDSKGRFLPGNSFCKGRAAGVRRRLHNELIEALAADFSENGVTAIARARKRSPVQYLKVCISLFPRDVNVNINAFGDMTDDELHARLRDIDRQYQEHFGTTIDADGRTVPPEEDETPQPLPALPTTN